MSSLISDKEKAAQLLERVIDDLESANRNLESLQSVELSDDFDRGIDTSERECHLLRQRVTKLQQNLFS